MTRPNEVILAVKLLWMALAIVMLELLANYYINFSEFKERMIGNPISPELFSCFVISLTFFIPAFFITMTYRRKNWARYFILLSLLLGILGYIKYFKFGLNANSFGLLSLVADLLKTGLQLYAIVLLFKFPVGKWFKGVKI